VDPDIFGAGLVAVLNLVGYMQWKLGEGVGCDILLIVRQGSKCFKQKNERLCSSDLHEWAPLHTCRDQRCEQTSLVEKEAEGSGERGVK
jgi:hypothetical protein